MSTDPSGTVSSVAGGDDRTIGITPVPDGLRRLRAVDVAALWGNLSVGILVLAAGAILVTATSDGGLGLSLGTAVAAALIGSVAGGFLLAAVAWAGHDAGQPSMALLRGVLGRHGSYAASVLNIVQLVGWTAFEFWAMSQFAGRISNEVFGATSDVAWVLAVALTCGALAIAGPLAVIKLALERVATWVLLLAFGILTMWLLVHGLGDTSGSSDAAPFAVAVDLVVAMPVSWLSVVNDYNRFSVNRRSNFVGTFSGTLLGNTWLYVLGALLVLSGRLTDASPAGIAVGVLGVGAGTVIGLLMLCSLLAGEAPNAFADIYSAVVSTQNLTRRVSYRLGVIVTVVIAAAIAAVATVSGFESFLFLLGSVFVPLFAVVLADALTSRPRMSPQGTEPGVRWRSCAAWSGGFAAYQWIVPTGPARWVSWVTGHVPGAGDHATFGASLPSFAIAFALAAATMRHRNDTDAPEHAATVHPPPH